MKKLVRTIAYQLSFTMAMSIWACKSMAADTLTMEQYLEMARKSDPSYQSSQLMKEGASKTQDGANLLTGINLISTLSSLSDARPTQNPNFQGDKTSNNSWAIGLQQQSSIGLAWTLTQNFSYTKINNAAISAVPVPEYYDSYPKLELTLPLWRNWWGSETKAGQSQLESQLKTQKLNAEMGFIQKESEIKEAFYNLATQQKNLEIQKESLQRTEKILSWSESRLQRNLSDKSDVFQTQALVSVRRIDLINAEAKLKEAARTFNSYIGVNSESVPARLVVDEIDLTPLKLQKNQTKVRLDLLMQKESIKSQEANYNAQKEKNKPSLNLAASYLKQGRDTTAAGAQSNTFKDNKDYLLVALNFSMPLDVGNLSDSKEGFSQLAESQVLAEKVRQRNEALQWQAAVDLAESLAAQLKVIRDLEATQKSKADLERNKYNNGRSTTYQVLMFEQDYTNSRNQRLNIELQLRKFINSLDLYKTSGF